MPTAINASLGYVGWIKLSGTGGAPYIRVTSADIKATQGIDKPSLIDGMYDKTTYKLMPIEIGGSLQFPAVYEAVQGSSMTPAEFLWQAAFYRSSSGRLLYPISTAQLKYYDGFGYTFTDCSPESYEFSVTQGDSVNINVGMWARTREPSVTATGPSYTNRNTRIVTWQDTQFVIGSGAGDNLLPKNTIRTFSFTLNNALQRFYTVGTGDLYPVDIAPTKRDLTGSITFMGVNQDIAALAASNDTRCYEHNTLSFGYSVNTGSCTSQFIVPFTGVVFQIEELGLSNELVESTVNYHVLPGMPGFPQ
jgi:hypothetical protein